MLEEILVTVAGKCLTEIGSSQQAVKEIRGEPDRWLGEPIPSRGDKCQGPELCLRQTAIMAGDEGSRDKGLRVDIRKSKGQKTRTWKV